MRRKQGFTLVEIMIVVLIIGILLSVVTPAWMNARTRSQTKTCISQLKQIEGAKEQALMENAAAANLNDLVPTYIKTTPLCPTGGGYAVQPPAVRPTCTNAASGHVLP